MIDYEITVLNAPQDVVVTSSLQTIVVDGFGGYMGPPGPQGSTIFSESGTTWNWGLPRVEGDLFINTENYDLFLYRDEAWVQIGNMKGPAGDWWAGTQAEYDALGTYSATRLYVII